MTEERKFGVRYDAHGFRGELPMRYDLTQAEAEWEVLAWRSFADTVGGDAEIMEKP